MRGFLSRFEGLHLIYTARHGCDVTVSMGMWGLVYYINYISICGSDIIVIQGARDRIYVVCSV